MVSRVSVQRFQFNIYENMLDSILEIMMIWIIAI